MKDQLAGHKIARHKISGQERYSVVYN